MDENVESPVQSVQEEGELSNDTDISDLFVVDNTPTVVTNNIETPTYDKKFREVLQVQKKEDVDAKPKRPKPPQNSCWNCGGEHSLRDCKEPKNPEAINRNRLLFMSKQGPRPKASRYHLDEEQKFPHIVAGRISKKLQRALGLQKSQLPRHIYRMRVLGYPPGWVEEAKVTHSGLTLFDSLGQEVVESGFEAGEIASEGAKDKFDFKKIVEYPGFNCPCGSDIIDETERLNSKPMAERDSIKFMKDMWQGKAVKAYKRRKMNTSDTTGTPGQGDRKGSLLLLDDMELDSEDAASSDDEGEVKGNDVECPGSSALFQADNNDKAECSEEALSPSTPAKALKRNRPDSPNSSDAKRLKMNDPVGNDCASPFNEESTPATPIAEENSNSTPAPDSPAPSTPAPSTPAPSTPAPSTPAPSTPAPSTPAPSTPAPSTPAPSTPGTPAGNITSVSLGTPVLVWSEFSSLPSADKFAKNICDVINFENLPDSTGKYEKMSGLLKKVRNVLTKHNLEEDE